MAVDTQQLAPQPGARVVVACGGATRDGVPRRTSDARKGVRAYPSDAVHFGPNRARRQHPASAGRWMRPSAALRSSTDHLPLARKVTVETRVTGEARGGRV